MEQTGGPAARALPDVAVGGAWLLVGALSFLAAVLCASVAAFGAPFWDQWWFTDPTEYLANLLERHNGHPILLGKLFFAADYALFGAQAWFLQVLTFATLAAAVGAFVALARLGGFRSTGLAAFAGLAATLMFNPQSWENLRWGFQVPFVMVFAAAVGGACALAYYAKRAQLWSLALSLLCSAIAIVSLANGVGVAILLVLMARYLNLPRRAVELHVLVAALAIPVLTAPNGSPPPSGDSTLLQMLLYVPRYVGGGLGLVVGNAMQTALVIGLVLIVVSVLSVFAVLRSPQRRDPVRVALVVLILFIGATAAGTAYGRAFIGAEQALEGRYAIANSVLVIALTLLISLLVKDRIGPKLRTGVVALGAVIAFAIPVKGALIAERLEGRALEETRGQTALVVGVPDEEAVRHLSFNMRLAARRSRALEEAGKWHFQDRWARAVGTNIETPNAPECAGAAAAERTSPDYVRLSGVLGRDAGGARTIVVLDRRGNVRGYGRRANSLAAMTFGLLGRSEAAWVGHARIRDRGGAWPVFTAYAASDRGIVCRIGPVAAPAPSAPSADPESP